MTSGPLERRIERLEARPARPEDLRAGLLRFQADGTLPRSTRVRQFTENISCAVEMMNASVPVTAPPGYVAPARAPQTYDATGLLPAPAAEAPQLHVACGTMMVPGAGGRLMCRKCGVQS